MLINWFRFGVGSGIDVSWFGVRGGSVGGPFLWWGLGALENYIVRTVRNCLLITDGFSMVLETSLLAVRSNLLRAYLHGDCQCLLTLVVIKPSF